MDRVRALQSWIRGHVKLDPGRLLVIIAARGDAAPLLAGSLPMLLASAQRRGLGLEIVLGFDTDVPPLETVRRIPGVGRIEVDPDPLAFAHAGSSTSASPVSGPTLWLVRNRGPAHGKTAVLWEIYARLLLPAMRGAGVAPAHVLGMDAESWIYAERQGLGVESCARGLASLLDEARRGADLVGTHLRMVQYARVDTGDREIPDLLAPVPAALEVISGLHGWLPGYRWLPGGGMLGRTDVLASLHSVLCERYPSSRVEDIHATIVAQAAGFKLRFAADVASTNRVHPEGVAGQSDQLVRWLRGVCGLEGLYGAAASSVVAGRCSPLQLTRDLPGILRQLAAPDTARRVLRARVARSLLAARREIRAAFETARQAPDRPESPTSGCGW